MGSSDLTSETNTGVAGTSPNNVLPPRIAPRCVTGACHPANKKSLDWSESCGLIAYGSHGAVVVVDSVSLQVRYAWSDIENLVFNTITIVLRSRPFGK